MVFFGVTESISKPTPPSQDPMDPNGLFWWTHGSGPRTLVAGHIRLTDFGLSKVPKSLIAIRAARFKILLVELVEYIIHINTWLLSVFLQLKCHVNCWFHPTRVISFQVRIAEWWVHTLLSPVDIVAHGISIYSSIHFLWHVLKPHHRWVNQNLYINNFNMYIDNDTSTSLKKWPEANNSLCHSQLWLSSIHPVVFLAVRRTWRNRLSSSPL